ncbi:hypothetical protein DEJ17_06360 [Curtobacterium sp. MCSS17_011]|uniref:ribosomal protein L7/L12 n=1 Tax=Curtobacterium sp. MCSS17_011 TaxID=2175643 RepID=UPI000D967938|nr:ribosomal protein L7/L12 [Curtobacterium sp. MCSS17_011]PYY59988.1 hypothetical protein DEJ17_06360 [Curtobacterium sp. MCSS17_011]
MTAKKLYTPAEVIEARGRIIDLTTDVLIAKGYINIAAVLADGTTYEVWLDSVNEKKIQSIKAIRSVTSMGLGEAKAVADTAPSIVLRGIDQNRARDAIRVLREHGASVSLRRVDA